MGEKKPWRYMLRGPGPYIVPLRPMGGALEPMPTMRMNFVTGRGGLEMLDYGLTLVDERRRIAHYGFGMMGAEPVIRKPAPSRRRRGR